MSTPTIEGPPTTAAVVAMAMQQAAQLAVMARELALVDAELRMVLAEVAGVLDCIMFATELTNPDERLQAHLDAVESFVAKLTAAPMVVS